MNITTIIVGNLVISNLIQTPANEVKKKKHCFVRRGKNLNIFSYLKIIYSQSQETIMKNGRKTICHGFIWILELTSIKEFPSMNDVSSYFDQKFNTSILL